MGRLPQYDEVEREALRKSISREPEPLPRVAGEEGEERTPEVWFCPDCGAPVTWSYALLDLTLAKRDLGAAQQRIRELEEERDRLARKVETELRVTVSALGRVDELAARLDRLRPVVRYVAAYLATPDTLEAKVGPWGELEDAIDALLPEDRVWAEGSQEEET